MLGSLTPRGSSASASPVAVVGGPLTLRDVRAATSWVGAFYFCLIGGGLLFAGIARLVSGSIPWGTLSGSPQVAAAMGVLLVGVGLYAGLRVNELTLDPATRTYTLRRGFRPWVRTTIGSFDDFNSVRTREGSRAGRLSELFIGRRDGESPLVFQALSPDEARAQAQVAASLLGVPADGGVRPDADWTGTDPA
jgi:hypothetical protein